MVWIPESARRQLVEERLQDEARLLAQVELKGRLDYFNRALKEIDPHLELVQVKPGATNPGLVPGCFYVMRRNPGTAPSMMKLEYDDGTPREPGSWMFEWLKDQDLWNGGDKRRAAARAEAEREKERRREREREELMNEAVTRWKSKNRESVLFSPDVKWRARS